MNVLKKPITLVIGILFSLLSHQNLSAQGVIKNYEWSHVGSVDPGRSVSLINTTGDGTAGSTFHLGFSGLEHERKYEIYYEIIDPSSNKVVMTRQGVSSGEPCPKRIDIEYYFKSDCKVSGIPTTANQISYRIVVNIWKKRKHRTCKYNPPYTRYILVTVASPAYTPPMVSPIVNYACANTKYTIYGTFTPNNLYQSQPNGIKWYKQNSALGTEDYMGTGFAKQFQVQAGQTIIGSAESYRVNETCEFKSVVKTPFTIIQQDLPLLPPAPQLVRVCSDVSTPAEIPKFSDYDGVLWYNASTDEPIAAIADGYTYTRTNIPSGISALYVQYYKNAYTGCKLYSPKTPIFYLNGPRLPRQFTSLNNVIYDHRDIGETECEVNGRDVANETLYPYHFDLPDLSAAQLATLNAALDEFKNTVNATPYIRITKAALRFGWKAKNNPHGAMNEFRDFNGQVKRVCPENITPDNNIKGTRAYALVAYFDYMVSTYQEVIAPGVIPTNVTPISQSATTETCEIEFPVGVVNIQLKPFGNESNGICTFPDEIVLSDILKTNDPGGSQPCSRNEFKTVCPNSKVSIGPDEETVYQIIKETTQDAVVVPNYQNYVSYSWSPVTGLDNPNVAKTYANYNTIPKDAYEIQIYRLKITYAPPPPMKGAVAYYCAYVYKCKSCQPTSTGTGTGLPVDISNQ